MRSVWYQSNPVGGFGPPSNIFCMGHSPERVTTAPPMGGNSAIRKIQTAKIRPNVRIPPSDLAEAYRTKYPRITKNVAGIRLAKKHITNA